MAAVMGLAAPSAAKDTEVGSWLVSDEPRCTASSVFEGNASIGILYDPAANFVLLQVRDNSLRGVVNDETYQVRLTFRRGDIIDKGWRIIDVTGLWDQDLGKGFQAKLNAKAMLDDLRGADRITFSQADDDSAVITAFDLADMAPVVDALRRCGQQRMAPHRAAAPPRRAPARRR